MLNAQFRPIDRWPGKMRLSYQRRRAPFRAKYAATLDLLEAELEKLKAKDIIIQAGFELRDIRNDGWPRSSARPSHPGIIVSFAGKTGPMSFPCDTFDAWEDNIRAIALSLQALRVVDRYGVTQNNEQYKGWARLPPPATSSNSGFPNVVEAAAEFLAQHSGFEAPHIRADRDRFRNAYRVAAARLHPDKPGGSNELFVRLQQAKSVLDKHHGVN